jgi:hypothetical protein
MYHEFWTFLQKFLHQYSYIQYVKKMALKRFYIQFFKTINVIFEVTSKDIVTLKYQ